MDLLWACLGVDGSYSADRESVAEASPTWLKALLPCRITGSSNLRSVPTSRALYDRTTRKREGKKHTQVLIVLAGWCVNGLWAMLRDGTTFQRLHLQILWSPSRLESAGLPSEDMTSRLVSRILHTIFREAWTTRIPTPRVTTAGT